MQENLSRQMQCEQIDHECNYPASPQREISRRAVGDDFGMWLHVEADVIVLSCGADKGIS